MQPKLKGKKGRPLGSPNKAVIGRKSQARLFGKEVLETLMEIATDGNQPGNVEVMAAREVLDRGFGKPTRPIKPDRDADAYDWDRLPRRQAEDRL